MRRKRLSKTSPAQRRSTGAGRSGGWGQGLLLLPAPAQGFCLSGFLTGPLPAHSVAQSVCQSHPSVGPAVVSRERHRRLCVHESEGHLFPRGRTSRATQCAQRTLGFLFLECPSPLTELLSEIPEPACDNQSRSKARKYLTNSLGPAELWSCLRGLQLVSYSPLCLSRAQHTAGKR